MVVDSCSCSCNVQYHASVVVYRKGLSVYPSVCLSIFLSIYPSPCLSIYLSMRILDNQASLRDLSDSPIRQHQKRSNSARRPRFFNVTTAKQRNFVRLPQFSMLTTSNMKQFCETSFNHGKLSAELTAPYQYRTFCDCSRRSSSAV